MSSVPQSRTNQLNAIWAHSKFWIALVVTFGLDALLVFFCTLWSTLFLSLTYLSLNFVLNFPTSLSFYSPKSIFIAPAQDKNITFLHLYLFTWLLLVLCMVGITFFFFLKPGLGGRYLMSTWNTCVGLAFVLAGITEVVAACHDEHCSVHDESYENFEGENVNERDRELSQTNLCLSFNILHNQARINDLEGIKGRLKSLLKLGGGFPSSSSLSPACYSFCSSDDARFRCDVADSTGQFFCCGQ